ncbi:hypothetical protein CU097_006243 [Rhizopus azygosporus]|uniref:Uncharacterized protein n=1 Tax=Rhizopus azygosporus TaxID=86630 RepID=A0A367J9N4_RHIAZ|nr:hypothetical protein CU097_006243 [Rhizopus azygosporus]
MRKSFFHTRLLKKGQTSSDLSKFFDKCILDAIKSDVISKFDIQFGILPAEIEQKLKSIVKGTMEKNINLKVAGPKTMTCYTEKMDTSVDDITFIIKNLPECLPHKKFNEITKDFMVRLVLTRSE